MKPSRRGLLQGLGAATVLTSCGLGQRQSLPALQGELRGLELAQRGHRVREPLTAAGGRGGLAGAPLRAEVVILGGGIAGLCAAWRLRWGGFEGTIALVELADVLGGTAAKGTGPSGEHPLGAHYLTLPSAECAHMRVLLDDLGLVEGWRGAGPLGEGRPVWPAEALCLAPQERLFVAGRWVEGLWPTPLASAADTEQRDVFEALAFAWAQRRGADGRWAFAIPVAHCSEDPEVRALVDLSFADWLDQHGLDSPLLRWWLRYATRDDYGTELADTSAWAGLHYFASRRPDPANARDLGTHVLTWPAGNGQLVDLLARRLEASLDLVQPAVARAVEAEEGRVHVEALDGSGDVLTLQAEHIVAAVPARVLDRLLTRPTAPRPDQAPWWVAQLHLAEQPVAEGLSHAWDSVVYEGVGLGAVSSAHQRGSYGGPTVLSWYHPLSQEAPAEARRRMLETTWEEVADLALADLSAGWPDLRRHLLRLDVHAWGHGTTRPTVGLHRGSALSEAAARVGRVLPAHSDLSGLSLFEEAAWQGVRAAEEILRDRGHEVRVSLL